MQAMEIRKGAAELRSIWAAGNEYLQDTAPWSAFKTDPDRAAAVVHLSLNLIRFYAVLSAPFIPDASKSLLEAMHTTDDSWPDDLYTALNALPPGHSFSVPDVLFAKITDDQRADWQIRFAGTRS